MLTIHSIAFYLHIVFGSAALLLLWVPVTSAKGQFNHIKFGGYYNSAMYLVALSGAVMALLVLWDPILIHGHRLSNPAHEALFIERMQLFYSLLLYLSLLVYCGLRQGVLALRAKTNKVALRAPQHLFINILLTLAGPILFYFGWQQEQKLPMIFAVLGTLSGFSNLKYALTPASNRNAWLREHISAQIGTAIGAYTAFIAFGGRTLFENIGDWRILFWVTPGILGSIAIRQLCQKYAPLAGTKSAK